MEKRPFLLTLILLTFLSFYCSSQNTYVPDDNFEQALIELGYDSGELNDSVPTENIRSVLTLNINQKNISDITGLQDFTSLENLYCSDNNLDTLNLSMFPNLFILECFNNQIRHLNVSQNILLADIQCSVNSLELLNLENNPNLNSIKCSGNQIQTITFNGTCIATELNCAYNQIEDLNTSQLVELQYIDCSYNQIADLDFSENTQLIQLNCNDNYLTSLNLRNGNSSQLGSFSALNNPDLYCIEIDDLSAVKSNEIWEKDEIAEYSEDCDAPIPMTYVPDDNFEQALINLGYDDELNDSVPTSSMESITVLDLDEKNIQDLTGIEACLNLNHLYCESNQLTELNLNANTNLFTLSCSRNQLSNLEIQLCTKLTRLYCSYNNLQELNFPKENIEKIYCRYNDLKDLDCSNCPNLSILVCSFNQLSGLSIKNSNIEIIDLVADGNPDLFCIEVEDVEKALSNGNMSFLPQVNFSTDCGNFTIDMTYVPDDNFEQALIDLGYDHVGILDDYVTTARISSIEEINISNKNISSLQGIESFTALKELNCSFNQLTQINLENNQILMHLECYNNPIKSINISQNTNIDFLSCSNCSLTSLNVKNGNNQNMFMDAHLNPDLFCIEVDDAEQAETLQNWHKDSHASYNINCAEFEIEMTYIPDDNFEQTLIDLGYDDVLDNYVPTKKINDVKSLNINMKNVEDLTGLEDFIHLESFYCEHNLFYQMDLSFLSTLKTIDCSGNKLEYLNVKNNDLSFFDASFNPNLFCIEVNNAEEALLKENWIKDSWASYSANCFFRGIPLNESNTLQDLYNSTNGSNWSNNSNWLDTINATVADWYGVTVQDEHVTEINLSNNNLQEAIFIEKVNLPELRVLNISNNLLDNADFSKLDSIADLTEIHVENNKFVFRHIRQLLELPYGATITYSPQAKIGVAQNIELEEGELLEINFNPNYFSEGDQFQWHKDGVAISGAQLGGFDISEVDETDSGVYTLKVTNSDVPGLTLESQEITVSVKSSENLVGGIPQEEYQALVDLYNATDGPNWKENMNWLDTINSTVADWHGINVEDGHVTMALLYDNDLKGFIPSSLADLTYLTNINFERNSIGKMPQSGLRDERVIPDEIGNIDNLIQLSLGYNYIQFNDLEAIRSWPNFNSIHGFSCNYQGGLNNQQEKVAEPGETVHISLQNYYPAPSDQFQWVKDNNPIPGANDSVLILNNVQLSDEANYYCILSNLKFPDMEITNYGTQLKVNDVHGAGVPFSEYKALEAFYNSTNGYNWSMNTNWLDTINSTVAEWAGIVVRDGHVVGIQLDSNNVVGILPAELYNLTYLEYLALAHNRMLSGTLSDKIGQLKNLEILSLSGCSLNGILPNQLQELDKLTHLYLANNQLSGEIPTSLAQCLSLKFLQLRNNLLSGEIPTQLGDLNLLKIIDLSNNQFSGTIPSALANLSLLRIFNLSNNQLFGPVPAELSQLEGITRFDISGNLFGATSDTKSADLIHTIENRQLPDDLGNLLTSMDTLLLGGNSLQFNDIEAIFSWPDFNSLNQFIYSPQNKISYLKTINVEEGDSVTLSLDNYFPGESDTYKWYRNNELISDANSMNLELNNVSQRDAGLYYCEVGNAIANQLILTSYDINLSVSPKHTIGGVLEKDYSELVNLSKYYPGVEFGNNWMDTANIEVNEWEGVTVRNHKVVALDLSNRGLEGEVFDLFSAFDSLEWVNLEGNNLYGSFPSFYGPKSEKVYTVEENAYNLKYLNIANNRFLFSDLEPVADELLAIDTFIYAPQQFIGIEVDTIVFKNSDHNIIIAGYNAGENDEYFWYRNDTLLNVSDAVYSIPEVTYQDSGIYTLSVQNSIFSALTLNSLPYKLGVKIPLNTSIIASGKLQIFPNPARNEIYVKTDGMVINLAILNIRGEKLQEFRNTSSRKINISNYAKGIYLFRIEMNNDISTQKIIFK